MSDEKEPVVTELEPESAEIENEISKDEKSDNNFVLILTGFLLFAIQVLYIVAKGQDGNITEQTNLNQFASLIVSVLDTWVPGGLGLFFVIFGSFDFSKKQGEEEINDEKIQ